MKKLWRRLKWKFRRYAQDDKIVISGNNISINGRRLNNVTGVRVERQMEEAFMASASVMRPYAFPVRVKVQVDLEVPSLDWNPPGEQAKPRRWWQVGKRGAA